MRFENKLCELNFRIGNIVTVKVTRDKGYRHSYKSGRTNSGFVYVLRGALTECFFDGTEIRIEPGEVLFVPKGARYIGVYGEDNTEVKIVQFDLISGELPPYLCQPVKIEIGKASDYIERFFSDESHGVIRHAFYYLSLAYDLLWKIDEHYSDVPVKYKRLRPALLELSEHFNINETVAHYAALCEMSEVGFRRTFKEYMGLSPVDYRNDLRLERARALLQSGEYNATEAAELSGFTNLSFFIRLYKKKFGHTPKKE